MSSSTSHLDLLTQSQYGHYITVNGLAGADTITATPAAAALILLDLLP